MDGFFRMALGLVSINQPPILRNLAEAAIQNDLPYFDKGDGANQSRRTPPLGSRGGDFWTLIREDSKLQRCYAEAQIPPQAVSP
jgi:hypothetical protein